MTEPASQHETVSERMLAVAAEIVALDTRLSLELSAHLVDKCFRITLQRYGLSALPSDVESIDVESRYRFALAVFQRIAEELQVRKVDSDDIEQVLSDLDDFYRGVRNIPDDR